MPQQNYTAPLLALGSRSSQDPAAVTTATNEDMAQVSSIAIGGTTDGTYTVQLASDLGTFQFPFAASGNTADQIADGLAAAVLADPDLLDLVDASSTSGTPLLLNFLNRGVTWTVSFPSNPGSNMVETTTTAAGATAVPVGQFVVVGSAQGFGSLPSGSSTSANVLGLALLEGLANVSDNDTTGTPSYPAGATMGLLRVGEGVAYAEGAIPFNAPVYMRISSATAAAPLGGIRVDADGGAAVLLTNVVTRSATSAAGPIKVLLNRP